MRCVSPLNLNGFSVVLIHNQLPYNMGKISNDNESAKYIKLINNNIAIYTCVVHVCGDMRCACLW